METPNIEDPEKFRTIELCSSRTSEQDPHQWKRKYTVQELEETR